MVVRTLLVDNYDSFTYNLVDMLERVNGARPTVVRNDAAWESLDLSSYDNVVLSPGPGTATNRADFGIGSDLILAGEVPVLGVCLGHQGLCAAFGAEIARLREPMHGRRSPIFHQGMDLFEGLPSPMSVVRYHSLVVTELPEEFDVLAATECGLVMAVRHRERPLWGVQFHPESVLSEFGDRLLTNFRDLTTAGRPRRAPSADVPAPPASTGDHPRGYVLEHRRVDVYPDSRLVFGELFGDAACACWIEGGARREPGGRFTIMADGSGPSAEYVTCDVESSTVTVTHGGSAEVYSGSLFDYLERTLRLRAVEPDPGLPFDFHLGYVGYLGYELKAETGGVPTHSSPYPDAALIFTDRAVVVDHDQKCVYLIGVRPSDMPPCSTRDWFDSASATIRATARSGEPAPAHPTPNRPNAPFRLRHGADAYCSLIARCQELIRAGETYEVCLTNMATVAADIDPVAVFCDLRRRYPTPYATLLRLPGLAVISASPERFLRVHTDGRIESKPMKGTRPRGTTAGADEELRCALRRSEKDRAENLMIVDLVRNDLSRVCEPGSVHVAELFEIESFASVHQMVSTVRGVLRRDTGVIDAIRALFPAGSMTGAPKIRTMRILDDLEGAARGIYSGSIGYLSLSGAADLSVAIRTMVSCDGQVRFGIGGAVTSLSDHAEEWAETMVKAVSSLRVLGIEDISRDTSVQPPGGLPAAW